MLRSFSSPTVVIVLLLAGLACRAPQDDTAAEIVISANDLQQSYLADARAAHARFDGSDLTIEGEVVRAHARFRGMTMQGEVTTPSFVQFRTDLDTLPHDSKYVQAEGGFDTPDSLNLWVIDSRIHEGEALRVSCPHAEIRWSEPAVYISDCYIASD